MNRMHLQMTHIPTIAEHEGFFFIWLSDATGVPSLDLSSDVLQTYIHSSPWHSYFISDAWPHASVAFEDDDQHIDHVPGLLVQMGPIYMLLQNKLTNPFAQTNFQFGESFSFWQQIAYGLDILIRNGQYYPTMWTIENEGTVYSYSYWLIVRKSLQELKIIPNWIRSVPHMVLTPCELAPVSINKWFDAVLDTWTDQIVRERAEIGLGLQQDHLQLVPSIDHTNEEGLFQLWLHQLTQPDNHYFHSFSNHDKQTSIQMNRLKKHIHQWHDPLTDLHKNPPGQALIAIKQEYMSTYIQPRSLLICPETLHDDQAFATETPWTMYVQVQGIMKDRSSTFTLEEIRNNDSSTRSWLMTELSRLNQLTSDMFQTQHLLGADQIGIKVTTADVMNLYALLKDTEDDRIQMVFPSWVNWKDYSEQQTTLHLQASVRHASSFSLADVADFVWEISIGDINISAQQFMDLVKQEQRFLAHDGEWIELPLEDMREAYEQMNHYTPNKGNSGQLSDVLHLTAALEKEEDSPVLLHMDKRIEEYVYSLFHHHIPQINVPVAFQGELRAYQLKGFSWLYSLREKRVGALLADDMGLGKTIQTIAYLQQVKKTTNTLLEPFLIICPTSVIGNWQRELAQFAPELKVYAHHGADRANQARFQQLMNIDVMITSYQLILRDIDWLSKEMWSAVILDEAQAIKNPAGKQSRAVRRLQGGHLIALTGTPLENRLEELWSIMDFLNPGYLGSREAFRRQFVLPVEKHKNQEKAQLLYRLIQPFLLRREKTDTRIINDLPNKQEQKEYCHLTTKQAALYQNVVDDLMRRMGSARGIAKKGLILATLTKLKQVCDHPELISRSLNNTPHTPDWSASGKLVHFEQLLQPILRQGDKALVFSQYVQMGKLLQSFLAKNYPECPVFFLHGGLPSVQREQLLEQFRSISDQPCVFILSLKAGGVGLNLTEARYVFHYDRWWNPAVENQATDRTYRIGQTKNVQVYKLISEGTLEENIDQLIDRKKSLSAQILGQSNSWITELSDNEVYDLIRLRKKVFS